MSEQGTPPGYGQPRRPEAPYPTLPLPSDGQPAYGQPSSGQPAYGQPAYGAPGYGQPEFGPPGYGFAPVPPLPGGPAPSGEGRRRGVLAAIIAAVAVVVVGAGALAIALTDNSSSTPSARTSLAAPSDVPTPSGFPTSDGSGSGKLPPISLPNLVPGGTGLPTGLPSGIPTIDIQLCRTASSGYDAASTYVGAALTGIGDFAQSCVYKNSVPKAVTASLQGKLFAPTTTDQAATDIRFSSIDDTSRITVHTKKEPDGHWYVVGVSTG